jgi:2-dehydro-3-deoxyphosphogluconate aldolase/(4S)-4-hydroxy-2-oxoglutarate aldolase
VGAGSVRRVEQLSEVGNLGVHFVVSPGSTQRLIAEAKRIEMPFVPGAATSSEMLNLYEHGYKLQKFFPAEQLGGIAMLRALSAPLPEIEFFPTGGLTTALANEYLKLVNVNCVGGSWFIPNNLLENKCFDKIGELAAAALNDVS